MTDQKTTPMDNKRRPPRKDANEQATLHAGQDDVTPPAMPAMKPGQWQPGGPSPTDQATVHAGQQEAGAPTVAAGTPGQWQPGSGSADEQATVHAGQQGGTAPTAPPAGGHGGFVRTAPADTPTPEPFWQRPGQQPLQQAGTPFGAPAPQQPEQADQHTRIMGREDEPKVRAELAWFAVFDGPDPDSVGKIHRLQPDHTSIGRHAGNNVVLVDSFCSALHARVRVEPNPDDAEPMFVLYDVGSANGTFIGDRQTYRDPESKSYRHVLRDGDFVLVGETTLVFKKV